VSDEPTTMPKTTDDAQRPMPVYLVRGEEPSLLADAVREVVDGALGADGVPAADAGMAVEDIPLVAGDDQRVAAVLDACLTPPFLTERRVVVVRQAGLLTTDEAARIADYLADPLDTTTLVLVGGGGAVPPKLVAEVKKVGEVIDAGLPRTAKDRTSWVTERVGRASISLDRDALQRLAEHLGEDIARLNGIVGALTAAYGVGARVTVDDLEPFLGEAGGVAPWDLTDAIDKGDQATALVHLHRMMSAGDRHPLVVLSTLHRHFGQMLRLDGSDARTDTEAAALLGLKGSTFPARKALTQARRLGPDRIRRAIVLLAEADLDLRGAKAWPEHLVMEILVARLCQLGRG
jgi:DNA polymerase-3 subunit delta